MKKLIPLVLVVMLAVVALAACGNNQQPDNNVPTTAPEAGGTTAPETETTTAPEDMELVIFGSAEEPMVAAVAQAFERETGIRTTFLRLSTGEVYTRIREEGGNPTADVWFGGTTDPFNQARLAGLLHAFVPENAANLRDPMLQDPDGYWHGIYVGYLGFIVNREELDRMGLPVPQDWEDLLDPMYRGLIAFANPGTSGTGRQLINTITMLYDFDEERAMDFFRRLDENIMIYPRSGAGPSRLVGPGEITIAIGFLHDGITQINAGFDNLELVAPASGTSFEIGATAIFEGAQNLEAAKKFIEFALSPASQEIGQTVGSYQFLTVVDANDPEVAQQVAGAKLIDYDWDWAAENTSRIVELWFETISADGRVED